MAVPASERASARTAGVPSLTLRLFGTLEVFLGGDPLPRLHSRKGQWLLALLALRAGGEVDRAWLAGTLWPDSGEAQGLKNLRNSLNDLRQALGLEAGRLRAPTPRTLALDLTGAEVDVVAFDRALARGDPAGLSQAIALYRGALLVECGEEWAFSERQVREQAYQGALERLATGALEAGDPEGAERYLRRAVAVNALRESAQRALMVTLAAGGSYAAAVQVYRELRLLLHRELNAEPDAKTRAVYERLRAEAREKAAPGSRLPAPGEEGGSPRSRRPEPALAGSWEPGAGSRSEATLTFLFTDVEGSTRLWQEHPEAMRQALARHDALLREVIEAYGGEVFKTVGDQFCVAFHSASAALAAGVAIQRALASEPWGETGPLRVRSALHTGPAEPRDGDYFGLSLNRVARVLNAGHGGQILLTRASQEQLHDPLPEGVELLDLGAHRLRDLVRPEQIFQVVGPDLPGDFPALDSLDVRPNNLPLQVTRFIGRETEMTEVKRLVGTTRLLTITGVGGTGKTRLAIQVAADLLPEYADGVWLVELASLSSPAFLPQSVGAVLDVREESGKPLTQTLVAVLRQKRVLLVLDNCEHLLDACAALAEALLRGCPEVRIIATSRESLNIPGETTYRLQPLSVPDPGNMPLRLAQLTQYEAVSLFVDRASAAVPAFAVTDQNAPVVAQICHRLDGIPLAIELAAARVKALPVELIQERLDDRFRLLTGGRRTALPRQQTLRALIDWSYDLLLETERTLLRRLSVFAGGWTLEAAEAICAGGIPTEGGSRIDEWEVLDLLTLLVDKSLVVHEEREGEARYRVLETVRQYGRDRLLETGEAEAVQRQHRDWFLELAERAEPHLSGPEQTAWLHRLQREHDNLRAALDCSQAEMAATGQEGISTPEAGLRLAGSLYRFWLVSGQFHEGQERLTSLLSQGVLASPTVRVKALTAAGSLAVMRGDLGPATALCEESLALARELGDAWCTALSLNCLGSLERFRGHWKAARALYEESLVISRKAGDQYNIALSLFCLGANAFQQEEYQQSAGVLEESLSFLRGEVQDRLLIVFSQNLLARSVQYLGDCRRAADLLTESLAHCQELRNQWGIAICLAGLAGVALALGQPMRAARLLGAGAAIRDASGSVLWPTLRADHDRTVTAVRAVLGEPAFAAASAEGRAMAPGQAIAYAFDRGPTA